MSPTSLILDIETLSRRQNAVITEIGLLAFNRSDFIPFDSELIQPGLFPQLAAGRHICQETITFHREKNSLPTAFPDTPIEQAYQQLAAFIHKHRPYRIWIQGKDFDVPKLDTLFEFIGQPLPWKYHQVKCARDPWDIAFGDDVKRDKRPHSAIGDCRATLHDLARSLIALGRPQAA